MGRRQFREIARVAGLVFQGYPGRRKPGRQVQASSSLLFLGDLVHGPVKDADRLNTQIRHWQQRHRDIRFYQVVGNHDRYAGEAPVGRGFEKTGDEIVIGPFVFSHKPGGLSSGYRMAGHLHPAVTLTGRGRQRETLPCFCFGPGTALLPAFGSFTGCQVIRPARDDSIYVIAGDAVIDLGADEPPARPFE